MSHYLSEGDKASISNAVFTECLKVTTAASLNEKKVATTAIESNPNSNKKDKEQTSLFDELNEANKKHNACPAATSADTDFVRAQAITTEIKAYVDAVCPLFDDDPLEWWSVNEKNYPNLAMLARRYLCIPATSAASERIFSVAGLVISEKRSRLSSTNAENSVMLHDAVLNYEKIGCDKRPKKVVVE